MSKRPRIKVKKPTVCVPCDGTGIDPKMNKRCVFCDGMGTTDHLLDILFRI